MLVNTTAECSKFIIKTEEKNLTRLSAQLEDHNTARKTYWSILNRFLNNKKYQIYHPSSFRAKLFQISLKKLSSLILHFAAQFTPEHQTTLLEFKTNQRLENITFTGDSINVLVKNLNVNEAHGWDSVSI